jgi:glycosyltransferase involved in cell wall biosynthesis
MSVAARVAIIHDWLDTWRGGENVLAEIVGLYPDADLFALVDFLPEALRAHILGKHARTSFLQHVPGAQRHFRMMLPLFPRAIESLNVSRYELVISSSHAVAKGVRTTEAQLHICYCHTPMRYAWDLRDQYLADGALASGVRGTFARLMLDRVRDWDRATSNRVDHFVANSAYIRDRIARCYERDATVIHPPVDVAFFTPSPTPLAPHARDYYLTASRFVPYKRIDLIVAAFAKLPAKRLIVVGEGPEAPRIRALAGTNVELMDELPREQLRELLRGARAFIFAAEEDFGILPVEAQACGTPVIAYGRGGALETVRNIGSPRPTGLFFATQTADDIAATVIEFDALQQNVAAVDCRDNAQQFSVPRFGREMREFVERAWAGFTARER